MPSASSNHMVCQYLLNENNNVSDMKVMRFY